MSAPGQERTSDFEINKGDAVRYRDVRTVASKR